MHASISLIVGFKVLTVNKPIFFGDRLGSFLFNIDPVTSFQCRPKQEAVETGDRRHSEPAGGGLPSESEPI